MVGACHLTLVSIAQQVSKLNQVTNGFVADGILEILFSFWAIYQFLDVLLTLLDFASFLFDPLEVTGDLTKGQICSLIVLLDFNRTQETFPLCVFD